MFGLWILIGLVLFGLAFMFAVGVVIAERKMSKLMTRQLNQRMNNVCGVSILVPGRGFVPADNRYHGR